MSEKTYSVSEITSKIKHLLEDSFPPIWVSGEISNFKHHSSGHLYFSLKDQRAQIRCVMFKSAASRLTFQPEHGMQVRLYGNLGVFEVQGSYQLYVEVMEPAGLGALHLAFERLKKMLQSEGLFDESRKKSLPVFPNRIGLVTSETGAAIRDIIHVITRRYPLVQLDLIPVRVQGAGAAADIARAILAFDHITNSDRPDLLIIGRGGGSLEDLWAFNEESVARAIADCSIPIISAVGHEIDFTISDFVADRRAPTPSAAAEMAVPERMDLLRQLSGYRDRMTLVLKQTLEHKGLHVNRLGASALFQPDRIIKEHRMKLDHTVSKMHENQDRFLYRTGTEVRRLRTQIMTSGPQMSLLKFSTELKILTQQIVQQNEYQLTVKQQKLTALITKFRRCNLDHYRHSLAVLVAGFQGFNPREILARGYAICTRRDGTVITSYREVRNRETVEVEVHEGKLDCKIEGRRFL
jgi:exodeoxyribonuclease VII large subunit